MFYNGELELELHRIGLDDYHFKLNSDRENCFEWLEEARRIHYTLILSVSKDARKEVSDNLKRAAT